MIDVNDEEGRTAVNVLASFDGMDNEVFSLILSMSECEDHQIGVLMYEGKEIGIFVRMGEWNIENWPEEEIIRLSRLQESVNVFLDQLYEAEGFTLI